MKEKRKKFKSNEELLSTILKAFFVFVITILVSTSIGGCATMQTNGTKDSIDNLSFTHDGKSVVFDRCREGDCQIQVYNLETGELAAYQSPKNERWTMGKYSYDGKRITFSVIPKKPEGGLDLGEMQIAVMDADGKNYKKVTTGSGAKLYPTFSHSGKKILYACAAYIREKGKTPAAKYDAWDVDLSTGKQTQLTFFKYFYMSNLAYFPDDERFIYYGDRPEEFKGMDWHKNVELFRKLTEESAAQGKKIDGVVVMKGKELITNPYKFPEETFPQKPLLSKDGSVLFYEKSQSGDFYLYSKDGNHRLIGGGGSVNSAAISPDGELLSMIATSLHIFTVRDGKRKVILYLPSAPKTITNWEEAYRRNKELYRMIPGTPSHICNW
jgi:Tol biopolymer transport system component